MIDCIYIHDMHDILLMYSSIASGVENDYLVIDSGRSYVGNGRFDMKFYILLEIYKYES